MVRLENIVENLSDLENEDDVIETPHCWKEVVWQFDKLLTRGGSCKKADAGFVAQLVIFVVTAVVLLD